MKKIRNWLSDKTLRSKLIISIVCIIMIPLVIIGGILSVFVTSTIKKNLCNSRLEAVKNASSNLEDYFKRIEEISVEAGESNSAARVAKSDAFLNDYLTTKQWMEGLMQNNVEFKNISLSNNGEIFMQRGVYIDQEDADSISKLMKDGVKNLWTLPRKMHVSPYVLTEEQETVVLTYYSKISEYYNWNQEQAVISVSFSEESLCKRYTDYFGSDYLDCFLVGKEGKVFSSTEKQSLGKKYQNHEQMKRMLDKKGLGFWKDNRDYYFYSYSDDMDSYIVENVSGASIDIALRPIWIIIFSAVFLCILFGVVFTYVQHFYMILPLKQLLNSIQKLKCGNFEIEKGKFNEDEIGKLNQEFQDMSMQLQKMLREVYISKINEQEAEIQVLLSQINPHFLYNTLDSIHWRAVKYKAYDVAEQIEALSDMYKYILNKGKKMIKLKEEIIFLENYFFIMKARYGNRIEFVFAVDEKYETVEIPKLILQPLVENAVLHGLEPLNNGGCIWIEVFENKNDLVISVKDNGIGTEGAILAEKVKKQEENDDALALKNIDMRMRLQYGEKYGIQILSEKQHGCQIILRIPYSQDNGLEDEKCE